MRTSSNRKTPPANFDAREYGAPVSAPEAFDAAAYLTLGIFGDNSVIRISDARALAQALRARYEHARAVTLIARMSNKALFGGRADEVVLWALVFAHYCGGDLTPSTQSELDVFAPFILRDPDATS